MTETKSLTTAPDHLSRSGIRTVPIPDSTVTTTSRLAGLLLLLYAQGPSAIHRLTTEDVEVGIHEVHLHLGDAPVQLPEPVAHLARTVTANRKGHATIGALTPSRWLFPGGQPGRPISTTQLTQRLNRLGIRPNQARSTALFQLATEIPAAILARTLAFTPTSPSPGSDFPQATGPPTPPRSASGRSGQINT
jgi:hypothetical protein